MAHYRFVRNRAFIRSIPGVGRDIHREHVAATCDPIPFYVSREDEITQRKMRNRLARNAAKEMGQNRFQAIQDMINAGRATAIRARSKVDKIARLGS